ncbi:MAG TPA: hypothetical protein VKB75_06845 [Jatrophihabitans sp.]|nr:hypothetical protein [Jatrophihabitans sp.]
MIRAVLATAVAALALAGCTSKSAAPPDTTRTNTQTVTSTRTPSVVAYTPSPARTVPPLPYGAKARQGEKDGSCPYIRTGLNEGAGGGVNLADLEGDRVYRTTLLTRYHPVGCRFYFYAPPYEAIADIEPRRFPTATDAFNAMVRTAEAGRHPITERNFVRGLTGICYQTKFFGPDGMRDWAFVFTKGNLMVVVHTQRSDTSRNALYIGRAIAAKF